MITVGDDVTVAAEELPEVVALNFCHFGAALGACLDPEYFHFSAAVVLPGFSFYFARSGSQRARTAVAHLDGQRGIILFSPVLFHASLPRLKTVSLAQAPVCLIYCFGDQVGIECGSIWLFTSYLPILSNLSPRIKQANFRFTSSNFSSFRKQSIVIRKTIPSILGASLVDARELDRIAPSMSTCSIPKCPKSYSL